MSPFTSLSLSPRRNSNMNSSEKYGERSGGVGELVARGRMQPLPPLSRRGRNAGVARAAQRAVALPREEGKQFVGKFTPAMDGTVKVAVADVSPLRRHHPRFALFSVRIAS